MLNISYISLYLTDTLAKAQTSPISQIDQQTNSHRASIMRLLLFLSIIRASVGSQIEPMYTGHSSQIGSVGPVNHLQLLSENPAAPT